MFSLLLHPASRIYSVLLFTDLRTTSQKNKGYHRIPLVSTCLPQFECNRQCTQRKKGRRLYLYRPGGTHGVHRGQHVHVPMQAACRWNVPRSDGRTAACVVNKSRRRHLLYPIDWESYPRFHGSVLQLPKHFSIDNVATCHACACGQRIFDKQNSFAFRTYVFIFISHFPCSLIYVCVVFLLLCTICM